MAPITKVVAVGTRNGKGESIVQLAFSNEDATLQAGIMMTAERARALAAAVTAAADASERVIIQPAAAGIRTN